MRLDKFISHSTSLSRTEVKKEIKHGAVTINQIVVRDPKLSIKPGTDQICLNEERLIEAQARYFMLHKPKGVVCANEDSEHPTVIDLIQENNKHTLQIAGRLDKDTTGLVLLTDDGKWNHRVTAPNKKCLKQYQVTLKESVQSRDEAELIERFNAGIQLKSENKVCAPATLSFVNDKEVKLAISEGKYHQVKRMFAAIGNHVIALHRESIGNISLDSGLDNGIDSSLPAGQYRCLTPEEINDFAH